ncbi:MAG: phosphoenolpyruvate--protein phosphotransferase [Gemmataceae bacterium]|nr:phosphoenolpyruvate--protein phosphotransferase [Gemmataceae bacterium]
MDTRRGTPVSPGVAAGPVLLLDTEWFRISRRKLRTADVDAEIERFRTAMAAAATEARQEQQNIGKQLGRQYGAIFEAHAMLLEDPAMSGEIELQIRTDEYAAEYAVSRVIRRYAKAFQSVGSSMLAGRASDLFDLERRVIGCLLGDRREELKHLTAPVIVMAHDLTPSQAAQLDPSKVHAFVTEAGGRTSHTSILAAALEIPAVVGVGPFLEDVSGGDEAIVDGNHGLVILDPDDATRAQYESARKTYVSFERSLDELRDLPAETKDGVRITLLGNIEFPHEAAHAVAKGAEGIGLYRTEFLYLSRDSDPTEEEHYKAYCEVLSHLPAGVPLVVRTLDLGADKFNPRSEPVSEEQNPALGVRSVRLCLQNLPLFKTQLRAIFRAAVHGDIRILFPMITTMRELRRCKLLLKEVKEDLFEDGVPFAREVPIGTMVEVPAAAILAGPMAREVDYLSIGTNDLVQYTLAADRTNEHVAELYSAVDPAVLFLIQRVLDEGRKAGKKVNVCGEMSGEPFFAALLLGMGLRQFSVTPHSIPEVKRVIRSLTLTEAENIAREALLLETASEVMNYLRTQSRRLLPELEL